MISNRFHLMDCWKLNCCWKQVAGDIIYFQQPHLHVEKKTVFFFKDVCSPDHGPVDAGNSTTVRFWSGNLSNFYFTRMFLEIGLLSWGKYFMFIQCQFCSLVFDWFEVLFCLINSRNLFFKNGHFSCPSPLSVPSRDVWLIQAPFKDKLCYLCTYFEEVY